MKQFTNMRNQPACLYSAYKHKSSHPHPGKVSTKATRVRQASGEVGKCRGGGGGVRRGWQAYGEVSRCQGASAGDVRGIGRCRGASAEVSRGWQDSEGVGGLVSCGGGHRQVSSGVPLTLLTALLFFFYSLSWLNQEKQKADSEL